MANNFALIYTKLFILILKRFSKNLVLIFKHIIHHLHLYFIALTFEALRTEKGGYEDTATLGEGSRVQHI